MVEPTPLCETQTAFAKRIRVSKQRVSQLVREGLPVRDGKVLVGPALGFVSKLSPAKRDAGKANAALTRRRAAVPADDDGDDAPPPAGPAAEDYWAARARRERAAASRVELALAREQGELLPATEVRQSVYVLAKAYRDAVMSLPMRITPTLAGELGCDPGALTRALDREVRAMLSDLPEATA